MCIENHQIICEKKEERRKALQNEQYLALENAIIRRLIMEYFLYFWKLPIYLIFMFWIVFISGQTKRSVSPEIYI